MSRSMHHRLIHAVFGLLAMVISSDLVTTAKDAVMSSSTHSKFVTCAGTPMFCGGFWQVIKDHFEISSLIAPEQENARA
ncbi:hypothetical protein [Pseudophaeobacter sp.]|uniref:hypothetical protein n=1 Tax=Pseudophaeobacter sp. TaxID=1971739 RepID=UPI0032996E1A